MLLEEKFNHMKKVVECQVKNIDYKISGNGPAIVLLHGFLESNTIWDDFTEILLHEFKVVAIDLPGHGESESISKIHSMNLMAEVVKKILLTEKIEQAVIVGHSMGGYVALCFAAENENLLKGLVLFHSHAAPDTEEAKEDRLRTINIVMQNKAGFIRRFIPDLFDQHQVSKYSESIKKLQDIAELMSQEAITAALSGMRNRESQLRYLTVSKIPILFIIGKHDSRMPYKQILAQVEIPLHSEVLLLDNVGHMGFIEAQGKTVQALRHFAIRCFNQ
jgi:pimeloyl-ACP methyl ester carboxylesterase